MPARAIPSMGSVPVLMGALISAHAHADIQFQLSPRAVGGGHSEGVALADLNGDGYIDAFIAQANAPNEIWFGSGNGHFDNSNQALGNAYTRGAAVADFDGDSDIDAFVANYGSHSTVWLNDGKGEFTNIGLRLGEYYTWGW